MVGAGGRELKVYESVEHLLRCINKRRWDDFRKGNLVRSGLIEPESEAGGSLVAKARLRC
jgi:hypothetical protein